MPIVSAHFPSLFHGVWDVATSEKWDWPQQTIGDWGRILSDGIQTRNCRRFWQINRWLLCSLESLQESKLWFTDPKQLSHSQVLHFRNLHQFHEPPLTKVGWTVERGHITPALKSTPWRCPFLLYSLFYSNFKPVLVLWPLLLHFLSATVSDFWFHYRPKSLPPNAWPILACWLCR